MQYHLIGIKGSGMASLACILQDSGNQVSGSDVANYIFTQRVLEERNIPITCFHASNIHKDATVIIGNAFNEENVEVKEAYEQNVKRYWYHEFLGEFLTGYRSIAVAGTHGKTTTTGMLSHVMAMVAPTGYLIGDGTGELPHNSTYFILESCEYQRHFLQYAPHYAMITNIELDHVDYYPDMDDYCQAFTTFANQVQKGIVLFGDDRAVRSLPVTTPHMYYGLKDHNDVQARNVIQTQEGMSFDVIYKNNVYGKFSLPFVGKPFLWNSLGVIAIGILEGLSAKLVEEGLQRFPGVKRRFTIEEQKDNVYIDDYAHHPTAVTYMIEAARIKYPNKKVIAIFKPDRYSRILHFKQAFAKAFNQADEVYLCDFPQNAQAEAGIRITIQDLCSACAHARIIQEDEQGAQVLASRGPAVYLFMSSKDIYIFKNIVKNFHFS